MAAAVAAISALAVASPAAANPVTIARSGSYGFWGGNDGTNVCGKDFYSAYIQFVAPYISRTPAYPNHTQTITTTSQIEQWTGTAWAFYKSDGGQTRVLPPGTEWALFTPVGSNTVAPGRYYRVVQFYEWRVNGVVVGRVTNVFDQYEYSAWAAWVAPTGSQASYCYIP
jgi:hypothetical protein